MHLVLFIQIVSSYPLDAQIQSSSQLFSRGGRTYLPPKPYVVREHHLPRWLTPFIFCSFIRFQTQMIKGLKTYTPIITLKSSVIPAYTRIHTHPKHSYMLPAYVFPVTLTYDFTSFFFINPWKLLSELR